jgi:hypothetical protein
MWTVAETGDVLAADDFERRFPEWKTELESRIAMVRGLRDAKPVATVAAPEIPKFVPRQKPAAPPQRFGWVIALSATAVVAFGTFLVVSLTPPEPVAKPPAAVVNPTRTNPDPAFSVPEDPQISNPSISPEAQTPPPLQPIMPWEMRHDLSVNDAHLTDVLSLIGDVTKVTIEVAPGMPDPVISVDFEQKTGLEMLTELGRQHGFTPLDQGRGSFLIVPAVESR